MKINLFFLLFIALILFSCEKQNEFSAEEIGNPITQIEKAPSIHPSILQSNWWNNLSSFEKEMIGVELATTSNQLKYEELQARMGVIQRKNKQNTFRASICPGFPTANPEGDVTLSTQSEVDDFGALKCKEIIGRLLILDPQNADPICDLSPLRKVKSIGSSMNITGGSCLTSLDGLEKIKSIGNLGPFGFVAVQGPVLSDIEALSKLKTITGTINIINCPSLTSVSNAFSKISSIESGKTSNPLTSQFTVNIDDNAILTDLSGLRNISTIEGDLIIDENGTLSNLDDFSNLNTVGRRIIVINNPSLQNVDGMSSVSSLGSSLIVFDNPSLSDCCGLFNLLCSDAPACTTNIVGGAVIINNNGATCTEVDIIAGGPCL